MALSNVAKANYIKLGSKGSWEPICIEDGTLRLDYREVRHDWSVSGLQSEIQKMFVDKDVSAGAATSHANQVLEFYNAGPETVWITFHGGFMWWCIADGPVVWLGGSDEKIEQRGSRLRQTASGWSNKSLGRAPLYENELNGALTQVKRYQGTICEVKQFDYLIRKLTDQDLLEVSQAKQARADALVSIHNLMKLLTPQDFELLVDLVFSESGWRRLNAIGGAQKDIDMELILPTTGERACIQVKSTTNQKQFEEYIVALDSRHEGRMFYVYHTAKGEITSGNANIHLIDGPKLSEMVLAAGLFDWLLKKAG